MPRFYFHLRNDIVADDQEGSVCEDLAAAREYALTNARSIAADAVRQGRLNLCHYIEIENEFGHVVATVTFKEAVKVEG